MTTVPGKAAPILRAVNVSKTYRGLRLGAASFQIFRELHLEVAAGELVAIVGESGAGKSTLLHILAALDQPTTGTVWCGQVDVTKLTGKEAAEFRNREVGYVWQFHYLLPEFTAAENVAMPLLAGGASRKHATEKASLWLEKIGLAHRGEHRAGELSGGEQQRVSIARALVTEPRLLLADEPTGDLDKASAEAVFALLQGLHRESARAGVLVTHSLEFAARCDRVLRLREGKLLSA